jgi:hypothetical protein
MIADQAKVKDGVSLKKDAPVCPAEEITKTLKSKIAS